MYTWEEIQSMSDEEVEAANAELGMKVFKRFIVYPILIVGASIISARLVEGYFQRKG